MALISKIRKNSWLLIVLIGLGLASFIMMDMFSGQKSIFGSNQTTLGEFEGKKLDFNEFSRTEQILYGNSGGDVYARRNYLWNYFVEKALLDNKADELGLGVSKEELMDLQFGNQVSPVIQQRFSNPNTRQLDRERLNSFKTAIESGELEGQSRLFWQQQEKEIIKERLQSKLSGMVSKGMYTPSWMAEQSHLDQSQRIDFAYVQVPFDDIDASAIGEPSDADYTNYLNNNKGQFIQDEETRKVAYLVFDVVPTGDDSTAIKAEIGKLIPDFRKAENDSTFALNNFGSYDGAYIKKELVSKEIPGDVFTAESGTIFGPYVDQNTYKAVKVIDRMVVPDSVKCRHILRRVSNQAELLAAQKTIDSLKTAINNGGDFEELAKTYSQDVSNASKGGDLGYAFINQMVKPFNDLIFYRAEKGKVYSVATQFGIHLVRVDNRKYISTEESVKLAYLSQSIIPSDNTQSAVYDNVLEFVGQNRTMEALQNSVNANSALSIEVSPPLLKSDYAVGALGSGQAARSMVRWAFQSSTSVDDVSPEIYNFQDAVEYYTNKYVVCALKSVQGAGLPALANIKEELRPLVMNEKKTALVKGADLNAIASQYSVEVDTAKAVSMSSPFIPGLGSEPKVVGRAFKQNVNAVSGAITGNNGAYVVMPIAKPAPAGEANIPQLKRTIALTNQSQVRGGLMKALRKNADIEDYRGKFQNF